MILLLSEQQVVNTLRSECSGWINSMSSLEKKAFRKYTYNSYDNKPNRFFERLNAMLRGGYNKADKNRLELYSKVLSNAIKRHPLEHEIVCYKGTDYDPTISISQGTKFYIDYFMSTSVIKTRALKGQYLLVIKVPAGSRGSYIEMVSAFPKQREFLLDKGCQYRFISKKGNVIRLEVIV